MTEIQNTSPRGCFCLLSSCLCVSEKDLRSILLRWGYYNLYIEKKSKQTNLKQTRQRKNDEKICWKTKINFTFSHFPSRRRVNVFCFISSFLWILYIKLYTVQTFVLFFSLFAWSRTITKKTFYSFFLLMLLFFGLVSQLIYRLTFPLHFLLEVRVRGKKKWPPFLCFACINV